MMGNEVNLVHSIKKKGGESRYLLFTKSKRGGKQQELKNATFSHMLNKRAKDHLRGNFKPDIYNLFFLYS